MSTLPGPYPVPKDSITPYKVTFDRLMRTLSELQFQADVLAENRAAGAVFDGVPFLLSMDSSERFLSIRAVWDTDFDAEKAGHLLFAAADSWNREKYFPTVYWMLDPAGSLQVCADFAVDPSAGLSDQQLTDHLGAGISTGIDAIRYMQEAATQTLGWVAPEATPYSASPEASAPAEPFAQPQPGSPASTDAEAEGRSAHSGAAFGL